MKLRQARLDEDGNTRARWEDSSKTARDLQDFKTYARKQETSKMTYTQRDHSVDSENTGRTFQERGKRKILFCLTFVLKDEVVFTQINARCKECKLKAKTNSSFKLQCEQSIVLPKVGCC